jgi:hypothetical protein
MGFYDCRCLVSGVSLKGADAALVLLEHAGTALAPVALAIKGNYNRLGAIDGIPQDSNTDLILRFFLAKLRNGEFAVDRDYLRPHGCYPIQSIEHLLHAFERNINDHPRAAVLRDRPIVFALISRAVWDGVARAAPPLREPVAAAFRRLFRDSPTAEEIYSGSLEQVAGPLHELSAILSLLAARGIAWRPPEDPCQHYAEEMRQFLEEARRAFRDSTVVGEALKDYQREVGHLLDEE